MKKDLMIAGRMYKILGVMNKKCLVKINQNKTK